MLPATRRIVKTLLEGRRFNLVVDLGCGEGIIGRLLKKHVDFLIGVDHNIGRLRLASLRGYYDELVHSEIQDYTLPIGTEAVFMLDSLEHMSKNDGYSVLGSLNHVPFVLITTPETFHKLGFRNHHQSHWAEQEFYSLGFQTMTYDLGLIGALLGSRRAILAVKGV